MKNCLWCHLLNKCKLAGYWKTFLVVQYTLGIILELLFSKDFFFKWGGASSGRVCYQQSYPVSLFSILGI